MEQGRDRSGRAGAVGGAGFAVVVVAMAAGGAGASGDAGVAPVVATADGVTAGADVGALLLVGAEATGGPALE